jgi:hypothetical protein
MDVLKDRHPIFPVDGMFSALSRKLRNPSYASSFSTKSFSTKNLLLPGTLSGLSVEGNLKDMGGL